MPGEIVNGNQPDSNHEALASQFPQEFLLVHVVLEGFAPVDEDDRDFVIELASKLGVGVHIDLLPGESSPPRKFGKALFDHFTQVASLAGIDHDAARI
jgi:Zn-dependent peptidase ImmA (M78 family)